MRNDPFGVTIEGARDFERVNREAERRREMGSLLNLDLNYSPPPSQNVPLSDSFQVQAQQSLDVQEISDDECLVISPRKFQKAVNKRNPSQRLGSQNHRNLDNFSGADNFFSLGPEAFRAVNTQLISMGISFDPFRAVNGMMSSGLFSANNAVPANTNETNVPMAPIELESDSAEPAFSCVICMGPLTEETSTKCGHIFCKTCIEEAISRQHKCPNCRRKLSKRDTFRVHLPQLK